VCIDPTSLSAVRSPSGPSVPASAQIDSTRSAKFVNAVHMGTPRWCRAPGSYQGMSWASAGWSRAPRQSHFASAAGRRTAVPPKVSSYATNKTDREFSHGPAKASCRSVRSTYLASKRPTPGRRPGDPRKSRLLLQGRPSPPGGFADTWPAPQRSDR
jgi:hypothetical protein